MKLVVEDGPSLFLSDREMALLELALGFAVANLDGLEEATDEEIGEELEQLRDKVTEEKW